MGWGVWWWGTVQAKTCIERAQRWFIYLTQLRAPDRCLDEDFKGRAYDGYSGRGQQEARDLRRHQGDTSLVNSYAAFRTPVNEASFHPVPTALSLPLPLPLPLTNPDTGPLCKCGLLFTVSSRMERGSKSCTASV